MFIGVPLLGVVTEWKLGEFYTQPMRWWGHIVAETNKSHHECGSTVFRRYHSLGMMINSLIIFCMVCVCVRSLPGKGNNISAILNRLLNESNSRLRPDFGGPPTIVQTDMNIRSMGPISEVDMTYSMDAYFRQTWVDKRLKFDGPPKELAVHIKVLERIWKPDTYFYNGQASYLHTITTPNKLLRIKQDGTILYSMRLTIKASCPMYLQYFPVDKQLCPLQFGSFAYTTDQLLYRWKHGADNSIKTAKDMLLSQFDLTGHPAWNFTVKNRSGEFSTLRVNFQLQRHMGYFLIQVYVPCTLLVILSWVSFWINREATADRIGLGITTVLTLTTLSMDTRNDLPKVPYATALDWFVIMCFSFVIASVLEFAGVHFFTKIGSGEMYQDVEDENDLEWEDVHETKPTPADISINDGGFDMSYMNSTSIYDKNQSSQYASDSKDISKDSCLVKFFRCLQGSTHYRKLMKQRTSVTGANSVSMIDIVSRILFPFSFITLSVIYWIAYTR